MLCKDEEALRFFLFLPAVRIHPQTAVRIQISSIAPYRTI